MSEEQTLSMEPVVNTENAESVDDLSNEEKDSLLIGEDMQRNQDNLLAGKYKDAAELETAHKELEKKLGENLSQFRRNQNQKLNLMRKLQKIRSKTFLISYGMKVVATS